MARTMWLATVKSVWQNLRNNPGPTITAIGIVSGLVGVLLFLLWKVSPASDVGRILIVVIMIGAGLSLILTGISAILKPLDKRLSLVIFGAGLSVSAMIILALYPALSPNRWYWPALWTIGGLYLVGISVLAISAFSNASARLTEIAGLEDRLKEAVANNHEKDTDIRSLREDLEKAHRELEEKDKVGKEEGIPDDIGKLTIGLKKTIDEFAQELNETTQLAVQRYRSKYEQIRNQVDDYKQRMERENVRLKEEANKRVLKNLLEPVDSIRRTLVVMKQTGDTAEDRRFIVEGIEGIRKQLGKVFERERAGIIEPVVGEELDKLRHEAVDQIETAAYPNDRVMEVDRVGYWIETSEGVVTEPAKVKASKQKMEESQNTETDLQTWTE